MFICDFRRIYKQILEIFFQLLKSFFLVDGVKFCSQCAFPSTRADRVSSAWGLSVSHLCIRTTQNSMFNILWFYFFKYKNAIHWKRKSVLCVRICSDSVKHDYSKHLRENLQKFTNGKADLDMMQKVKRGRLNDHQYRKRWSKSCEIIYEIHIPLNFSFWWINLILHINPILPM